MFWDCENFNSDLSNWDVSNGEDFEGMFSDCKNLTSLDVSNWEVGNGENFGGMFPTHNFHVRPVLYLNPDVKITGGNGTSANPYTLGL